jgi:hypothetical protein
MKLPHQMNGMSTMTIRSGNKMGSLAIPVVKPGGGSDPVILNLSKKDAAFEVLQALAQGGWVILKNCTDISKRDEEILSNKVLFPQALAVHR